MVVKLGIICRNWEKRTDNAKTATGLPMGKAAHILPLHGAIRHFSDKGEENSKGGLKNLSKNYRIF
jgi:hypothetical protein